MIQPDFGTGLVFIAITAAFIIVSGITWRIIFPVFFRDCRDWGDIALDGTLCAGVSSEQIRLSNLTSLNEFIHGSILIPIHQMKDDI